MEKNKAKTVNKDVDIWGVEGEGGCAFENADSDVFLTWKLYSPHEVLREHIDPFLECMKWDIYSLWGPSEAPQKFVKLSPFFLFSYIFRETIDSKASLYYVKHPFMYIYPYVYHLHRQRRTPTL